jgi:hypothetical protein
MLAVDFVGGHLFVVQMISTDLVVSALGGKLILFPIPTVLNLLSSPSPLPIRPSFGFPVHQSLPDIFLIFLFSQWP